ncbi:hypothetical protein LCGC14_1239320 [marine sediment metagenome]|uniref:Uncharacterized protein n=1 Tax=marine sediment metagenome TaxID=412755 RepID=A0A0F9LTH3_9ZZZZ
MKKLLCSICRKEKTVKEFRKAKSRKSGRSSWCNPCAAQYNTSWRKRNLAKARQSGRNYAKRLHARLKKEGTPYYSEPRSRSEFKKKVKALVYNAIRRGDIVRPKSCQKCGKRGVRLDAHHEDYKKTMEVVFLCTACHGIKHRKEIKL